MKVFLRSKGISLLTHNFIACKIGFVVGDVGISNIGDVISGQFPVIVASIHALGLVNRILNGAVGLVHHDHRFNGGIAAQHGIHFFELLQEWIFVAKEKFIDSSLLSEPSKTHLYGEIPDIPFQ